MKDMAISSVDSALSSAGVDKEAFDQQAQQVEESPEIQAKVDELSKDGLTEAEQTEIGGMVADKALEAMGVDYDGLSDQQKMALAEYCGNCLDGQASEAVTESEAAT